MASTPSIRSDRDGSPRCDACGHVASLRARYCEQCGTPLSTVAGVSATDTPPELAERIARARAAIEGERKQVTVMFVDIVGSMEIAASLDAERWREILDRFLVIAAHAVHSVEGTVHQFTGDGVMALFGAPLAHEDHAQRGCMAALELQRDLVRFAEQLERQSETAFRVRCGLNSGEVIIGSIGENLRMEYASIGNTNGLAKRLESLAPPGSIAVSGSTAALVEGEFELRSLGEHAIKGVPDLQPAFELLRGRVRTRLEAAAARGLSRFVGREQEMSALEESRERAQAGAGQIVAIVGDAGVGKSRLCHEFARRWQASGAPVHHLAGQAHSRSLAFAPVLRMLRGYFGISAVDSDEAARERIGSLAVELNEELPLLFDFLGIPDPARPVERLNPEARHRRLGALMARLGATLGATEPGLFVFEDIHWIDPASEALLRTHIEALGGSRSLTVVNFRPEHRAEWLTGCRRIELAPLGTEATDGLLNDLLGSDPSLEGIRALVGDRAQGNPFFVEEMVKALVEQGNLAGERGHRRLLREPDPEQLPASVQAVITARIDGLCEGDKAVLQAASVFGSEFAKPVLQEVTELAASELDTALGRLMSSEFVHEQLSSEESCAFNHPIIQQVAYWSQLKRRRRALHRRVAEAVVSTHPERLDERAALLAAHWDAACDEVEAARWHARAGSWVGTGDPSAALSHWRRVRELTDLMPASQETESLGFAARTNMVMFGWRLGISREEADTLFREAEDLAARAGELRPRALLLANYGFVMAIRGGEMGAAARTARRAIDLGEKAGDPSLYLELAGSVWYPLFLVGSYREVVAVAERGIELADGDPAVGAGMAVACPYAFCHVFKGLNLCFLGDLDTAGEFIRLGQDLAREQEDVEVVGFGHLVSAWRDFLRGEAESAYHHARRALEITERIGDSFARRAAWAYLGVAESMRGHWRASIEALERSVDISQGHRAGVEFAPMRLAFLAEAHLQLGEIAQARKEVAQASEVARSLDIAPAGPLVGITESRVLLGAVGGAARAQVEALLADALQVARETGAKAYEPQVHVELAALAGRRGDGRGRRRELQEAHRLFTEIGAQAHATRLASELATAAV